MLFVCVYLSIEWFRAEQPYLEQTGSETYSEWQRRQQGQRGPQGEELLEEKTLKVGLKWHSGLRQVANLDDANCDAKRELGWSPMVPKWNMQDKE